MSTATAAAAAKAALARQARDDKQRLAEEKRAAAKADKIKASEREAAEQKAAYRVFTPTPAQWPEFRWPLIGRLSSPFGLIPSIRNPQALAISVLADVLDRMHR